MCSSTHDVWIPRPIFLRGVSSTPTSRHGLITISQHLVATPQAIAIGSKNGYYGRSGQGCVLELPGHVGCLEDGQTYDGLWSSAAKKTAWRGFDVCHDGNQITILLSGNIATNNCPNYMQRDTNFVNLLSSTASYESAPGLSIVCIHVGM